MKKNNVFSTFAAFLCLCATIVATIWYFRDTPCVKKLVGLFTSQTDDNSEDDIYDSFTVHENDEEPEAEEIPVSSKVRRGYISIDL